MLQFTPFAFISTLFSGGFYLSKPRFFDHKLSYWPTDAVILINRNIEYSQGLRFTFSNNQLQYSILTFHAS